MDLLETHRAEADVQRALRPKPAAGFNKLLEPKGQGGITILKAIGAYDALSMAHQSGLRPAAVMLDPWYWPVRGGTKKRPILPLVELIALAGQIGDHVLIWGWPRQVASLVERIPPPLMYVDWITWHYRNIPSMGRRWRGSQQTCLHLCRPEAKFYPQNFMSPVQAKRYKAGSLRFVPGPSPVIEQSAIVGWAGRAQKVNHPAQKPTSVFEYVLRMTCAKGDLVIDPMAGSGTTGAVAKTLGLRAILSDEKARYIRLMSKRLGVKPTNSGPAARLNGK